MKRMITLGAAIVAALSMNSVAVAQEVTIKRASPKIGESRLTTDKSGMNAKFAITQNGKKRDVKQVVHELSTTKVTILAKTGDKVTQLKIHVKKDVEKQDIDGKEQEEKSPLSGKTFILEKKAGKVHVTDEAGKKVDDRTAGLVAGKYGHEFDEFDDKFGLILPKRSLKVGETITIDKKLASRFFSDAAGEDPMNVESFTLKLIGAKKINGATVAVFEMHFKGGGKAGPTMTLDLNLKGAAHIDVDTGYPHLMSFKGSAIMNDKNPQMSMSGKGEMHLKRLSVYGKASKAASQPSK